jgi:DNA-binding transcriptional MerR regulator
MARRSNRRRNTGKRNADMVTLVTWEHTKSRPTRRKVPYTHAVTMLDRGGFAKAQVLGEYDQILHERKSNRRRNPAASVPAYMSLRRQNYAAVVELHGRHQVVGAGRTKQQARNAGSIYEKSGYSVAVWPVVDGKAVRQTRRNTRRNYQTHTGDVKAEKDEISGYWALWVYPNERMKGYEQTHSSAVTDHVFGSKKAAQKTLKKVQRMLDAGMNIQQIGSALRNRKNTRRNAPKVIIKGPQSSRWSTYYESGPPTTIHRTHFLTKEAAIKHAKSTSTRTNEFVIVLSGVREIAAYLRGVKR